MLKHYSLNQNRSMFNILKTRIANYILQSEINDVRISNIVLTSLFAK